jgi:hypothetical protein
MIYTIPFSCSVKVLAGAGFRVILSLKRYSLIFTDAFVVKDNNLVTGTFILKWKSNIYVACGVYQYSLLIEGSNTSFLLQEKFIKG